MEESAHRQDLFISHASKDKAEYIYPLAQALVTHGVSFWLDDAEVKWGDSIALKVNEGLRESRFVLLCLSSNFLSRPWPELEMNAALSVASAEHSKRILPLILNSKEEVLRAYPLIAAFSYREFSDGPAQLALELSNFIGPVKSTEGEIRVTIESVHSGQRHHLLVSSRVSIKWLAERVKARAGVRTSVDVGALDAFQVRWVLVDSRAEGAWKRLPRHERRKLRAIVQREDGVRLVEEETVQLDSIGVYDGVVFHLHAVEDEDFDVVLWNNRGPKGTFGGGFVA